VAETSRRQLSLLENERGWTARLTYDDEVVVYCPACDEREFGDRE
jgi:hypothetical protein